MCSVIRLYAMLTVSALSADVATWSVKKVHPNGAKRDVFCSGPLLAQVVGFLTDLELDRAAHRARTGGINGRALLQLGEADLKSELGLTPLQIRHFHAALADSGARSGKCSAGQCGVKAAVRLPVFLF